jgi:SAM-dependent methyltransferase
MIFHDRAPSDLPVARAGFDRLDRCWPLVFELEGWLLSPNTAFDQIDFHLNGNLLGHAEPVRRNDVRDTFPWIARAESSGFRFKIDPFLTRPGFNLVELIGHVDGRPAGSAHTLFRADLDDITPTPPAELMDRVAGHHERITFKLGGIKCFGDFQELIQRHCRAAPVRRLLDWGCGCGRVTTHFLREHTGTEVFGCDIDKDAVAWCAENLDGGRFSHIGLWPPLPYAAATFDVITGYSVFTHLTRQAQAAWLAELKRVLVPGGILIASVHGRFAAAFEWPPQRAAELLRDGIFDQNPDPSLSNVVDSEYYQNTFQTPEYTMQEWSKHMEIVDYEEARMNTYQDVVVLRR